jgi:hypothetical protein
MEVSNELATSIRTKIQSMGPTLASGKQMLTERVYKEVDTFKIEVFPNEGQHRGRPHCKVTTDKGAVTVDAKTGEILAGNAGHWTATVCKVVLAHSDGICDLWEKMRPEDQKLPRKDGQ